MAKRVNLRWVAAPELSAAHATCMVATGAPCADPKLEQLLAEPVADINNRLLSASIEMGSFWKQYRSQILAGSDISPACTRALMAGGCSELQMDQLTKAVTRQLSEARRAFQAKYPKLAEQLDLRARPLRDRWGTVGPGLLREVERQIWANSPPDDWWMPRVLTLMVQPVRGGDGDFDSQHAKFWMEAMLTDTDPSVPEILRIVWLITRMAIDQHTRDRSADQSLAHPWALVSVPLVLTAAVELEMVSRDLPIRRAMELWNFGDAAVAEILHQWWLQHTANPIPLPVALRQLQNLLPNSEG